MHININRARVYVFSILIDRTINYNILKYIKKYCCDKWML